MEIIFSLVRKLVALVIVAGFCELLLPEGKFRSYARLVVGLMVLALILQPFAEANSSQFNWDELLNIPSLSPQGDTAASQWQLEQTRKLVEEQLAGEIQGMLPPDYRGTTVKVQLDLEYSQQGNLSSVRSMVVYILVQDSVRPVQPVKIGEPPPERFRQWSRQEVRIIAGKLGLSEDKITVFDEKG